MSLIEDALRRVQNPSLPQVPLPQEPEARRPATPPPKPAAPHPTLRTSRSVSVTARTLAIGAGVLIAAGLAAGAASWLSRSRPLSEGPEARPAAQTQTLPSALPPTVPSEPPVPAPAELPRPAYVVTGIAEGAGAPYVVINGQIVGVGDMVDGATLVEITDGTARLRTADGEDVALRIPR